ncbi:MAG: hypothetical protein ACTSV1_02580 [Alphaproteobacteria bacterium]
MKIRNFQHIQDLVLAELYDRIMRDIEGFNPDDTGRSEFKFQLSPRLISKAVLSLRENNLAELNSDAYEIEISAKGILHVERMIEEHPSSDIALYLSDTLPVDDNGQIETEQGEVKSSDQWEPLPIDRDSSEYQTAVSESESALETIQSDNGFAASQPDERNHIVWAVGAGLNALKEGLVTREQVQSLLLAPFRRVVKLFTEGLMKEAAEGAIDAVVSWLRSLG